LLLGVSDFRTDGFRDHSNTTTTIFNAKYKRDINSLTKLQLIANFANSPMAQDPGGINFDDILVSRTQARQRNVDFAAGEKIKHLKLAGSISREIKNANFNSSIFYQRRKFDASLPFTNGGIIDLTRNYFGSTSNYQVRSIKKNFVIKALIGYDLFFQNDNRVRFNNDLGTATEESLNQLESFTNAAAYITSQLETQAGRRYVYFRW